MRWIEATWEQRAAIVARHERAIEARIRTPANQESLRNAIGDCERRIAEKRAELEAGGFARRLNRQIGDLEAELAELRKEIR